MYHSHDNNIFKKILKNHGIKILKMLDENTFEILIEFTKNGVSGEEIQTLCFKSVSELLSWLGY